MLYELYFLCCLLSPIFIHYSYTFPEKIIKLENPLLRKGLFFILHMKKNPNILIFSYFQRPTKPGDMERISLASFRKKLMQQITYMSCRNTMCLWGEPWNPVNHTSCWFRNHTDFVLYMKNHFTLISSMGFCVILHFTFL